MSFCFPVCFWCLLSNKILLSKILLRFAFEFSGCLLSTKSYKWTGNAWALNFASDELKANRELILMVNSPKNSSKQLKKHRF